MNALPPNHLQAYRLLDALEEAIACIKSCVQKTKPCNEAVASRIEKKCNDMIEQVTAVKTRFTGNVGEENEFWVEEEEILEAVCIKLTNGIKRELNHIVKYYKLGELKGFDITFVSIHLTLGIIEHQGF